jgi:hypothetical protein
MRNSKYMIGDNWEMEQALTSLQYYFFLKTGRRREEKQMFILTIKKKQIEENV